MYGVSVAWKEGPELITEVTSSTAKVGACRRRTFGGNLLRPAFTFDKSLVTSKAAIKSLATGCYEFSDITLRKSASVFRNCAVTIFDSSPRWRFQDVCGLFFVPSQPSDRRTPPRCGAWGRMHPARMVIAKGVTTFADTEQLLLALVEYSRGTSLSRPSRKAAPLPIAAMSAVAAIGPMSGIATSCASECWVGQQRSARTKLPSRTQGGD
jgi:hypothetical protein